MPARLQLSLIFKFAVVLGFAQILLSGFYYQSQIPAALIGKWRLKAVGSKLIGSLEIQADGRYTYNVIPNYKEVGRLTTASQHGQNQLDLVATSRNRTTELTRGIFLIRGSQLQLHLGKKNDERPVNFTADSRKGILWLGSK